MLVTEEEAKAKWCPFARENDGGFRPTTVNRGIGETCNCLASACMAWRRKWPGIPDDATITGSPTVVSAHGYCGLAGKP